MAEQPERQINADDKRAPEMPRVVAATELFQGSREIWIEYLGERYRLRITRRNRLILQK